MANDFKGPFTGPDGECHPLSILDDCSRYSVGLYGLRTTRMDPVQALLQETFNRYGVPDAMLMDHGAPWWSTSNGWGLTRLSVDSDQARIDLIYGGSGHPQTQGKVERFHRTLKDSVAHQGNRSGGRSGPIPERLSPGIQSCSAHESLQMGVPAERYRRSSRGYNPKPAPWEYPCGVAGEPAQQPGVSDRARAPFLRM